MTFILIKKEMEEYMSRAETIASIIGSILMVLSIFVIIFMLAERVGRSEQKQAEIDVQAEQDRSAQIQAFEDSVLDRSISIVNNLYYVQDSRTELCFAIRSVYRHGYLSAVDCAEIPASMLHVTNTTEE
jgi:ABC-type Na+ efflux pump permease subunit